VHPCDVSGRHSGEALHQEKESEPDLEERTGMERTRPTLYPRTSRIALAVKRAYPATPQIAKELGTNRAINGARQNTIAPIRLTALYRQRHHVRPREIDRTEYAYPCLIRTIRCATQTREYPAIGQAAAASGADSTLQQRRMFRRLGR
jgi:hypothetical protein